MTTTSYKLKAFNDQGYSDCELVLTIANRYKLQLISNRLKINLEFEDDFPFVALKKIRQELDHMHIKLLCNGSRIDVYPSGMSLSSLMAYELKMGQPAISLVNIFEPADVEKIVSVEEQGVYRSQWLKSLKKSSQ